MSKNQDEAQKVLQQFASDPKNKIVSRMFDVYRSNVMARDAPPVQVLECKRAFFAGARSLLDIMAMASDPGDDATIDDIKFMDAIDNELTEYMSEGQLTEHTNLPPQGRA